MMIDERRRKALTAGFVLRWNSKLSCGIRYVAMELLAGVCDPGQDPTPVLIIVAVLGIISGAPAGVTGNV
jgi:hypothetical protein